MIAHVATRSAAQPSTLRFLSQADIRHGSLELDEHELVWVDIADPQDEDLDWLGRNCGFHPLALEDVARRHQRAKIDEYPGYYFVVLYAARIEAAARRIQTSELQFFWGEKLLVTIHTDPLTEIEQLAQRARDGTLTPVFGADRRAMDSADLVYRLLDAIVDGYFPAVDTLAEWTEDIEETMFAPARSRSNQDTLQMIFGLKKDLLKMRKTIAPSREVLNVMLRRDRSLFSDEFFPYFQDVYDHTVRVIDSLDTYRDLLASALDTHLAIVSNDVSQTVKRMTAVTAILMVNALVVGVYGMNFDVMPELHWIYGYPYALGLMATLSLGLWLVFRLIRWL